MPETAEVLEMKDLDPDIVEEAAAAYTKALGDIEEAEAVHAFWKENINAPPMIAFLEGMEADIDRASLTWETTDNKALIDLKANVKAKRNLLAKFENLPGEAETRLNDAKTRRFTMERDNGLFLEAAGFEFTRPDPIPDEPDDAPDDLDADDYIDTHDATGDGFEDLETDPEDPEPK